MVYDVPAEKEGEDFASQVLPLPELPHLGGRLADIEWTFSISDPNASRVSATPVPILDTASQGDPNVSMVLVSPDPSDPNAEEAAATELIGFVVRGRWLHERLQIIDLDSLVTPDGRRWLPLLRVLNAFQIKPEEQGSTLRFAPEGVGVVEVDIATGLIQIQNQTRTIPLRQAVSEITLKSDIYVLPKDLWEILGMELQWDPEMYEYHIQLGRKLSIWKLPSGSSLLAIPTQFVGADLPESLPPADRSRAPLQLIQVDWRPSYNWRQSNSGDSEPTDTRIVQIDGPRETFWGNLYEGQYRVQVSHPSRLWSNTQGWHWPNDDAYVAQLDWFEWVHRLGSAEITTGDSSFGLSNLVYPAFQATGVRINGLIGCTAEELRADRSNRGLHQYFGRTYIFEGPAPIDAEVELLINGKTADIQGVRPDAESPPGMGVYRFQDIELPSGILNEVTIVIRESSGNEIRVEKAIAGTPQLLPQGHAAYLAIAGTRRETMMPPMDAFDAGDFYGYITGSRILYGLTDRLTVGATAAAEGDHYHRLLMTDHSPTQRSYPESSSQIGTTLSYMPLDNLILSGDMAGSWGQGQNEYQDVAARSRAEYLVTRDLTLNLDLLRIGSDYFDGTNPDISDRHGGETGLIWRLHKNWTLEAGIGQMRNNLDGQMEETTEVNYQNIGMTTTVVPRTSLSARLNNLDVSTEENPRWLTELGLRVMPTRDVSLFGRVYLGEELSVEGEDRFLSTLRLRHAPRHLRPSQYWTLRKSLDVDSSIGLAYNDTDYEESLSLVHDRNLRIKGHPLRLRAELLMELADDLEGPGYGFRGRAEYLLDNVGSNYLGATADYRYGDYAFTLYLNLRNLYTQHDRRIVNVTASRVRTGYGAVHGKVFVDYNGNHLLDSDEPGVPNIKVHLGPYLTAVTDQRGYYVLSVPSNTSEVRLYLDPDTVPAIYSVTHGTQLARTCRDSLTEVNLGLSPLISVLGHIVVIEPTVPEPNAADPNLSEARPTILDPRASGPSDVATKPVSGVRVSLTDTQSGRLVAESFTAADGSYYMGDVKPGRYWLRVDAKSLPPTYAMIEQERLLVVEPTREDFLEIEMPAFQATIDESPATPQENGSKEAP